MVQKFNGYFKVGEYTYISNGTSKSDVWEWRYDTDNKMYYKWSTKEAYVGEWVYTNENFVPEFVKLRVSIGS